MAQERLSATAPGSTMFLGEYAVLFNETAIVCAIDRLMKATLTPTHDSRITIHSSLGQYIGDLNQLVIEPPFEFVLTAIQKLHTGKNGFVLDIEAQFSDTLGFGSSAAVTVATAAVILQHNQHIFTPQELCQYCRGIIKLVQGNGSGADVAASVFGGLIAYRQHPLIIEQLPPIPPIHLIYSGHKARTKDVIRSIIEEAEHNPSLRKLFKRAGKNVSVAKTAINKGDWPTLGKAMQVYQRMLSLLGTSTPNLDAIIDACVNTPTVIGAKISGAGFGDCVIALGELAKDTFPQNRTQCQQGIRQFDIGIAAQGVDIQTQGIQH